MSYRWRYNSITGSQIINAREYDKNYSQYTSVINGGFDRDNFPVNSITFDDFEDKSVGRFLLVNNINAKDDHGIVNDSNFTGGTVNPRGNTIKGLKYDDDPIQNGGYWFPVGNTGTLDCEEGIAVIRFHINSFCPKYYHHFKRGTSSKVARKSRQWKIEVDGVEVSRTSEIFPIFHCSQMFVQVPISKGNHEFQVFCRVPTQKPGDVSSGQVVLNYWGGQLSVHNRRR
tara:strand:+ start:1553 stop:2236 length:684 start_codon:yes stop_codon:yes gene_type:complete